MKQGIKKSTLLMDVTDSTRELCQNNLHFEGLTPC